MKMTVGFNVIKTTQISMLEISVVHNSAKNVLVLCKSSDKVLYFTKFHKNISSGAKFMGRT